jgi:GPH family glycoside/pentoside/hexuronide:cation symporter
MMLANSANLLVYTLFPMFVQMASPKDRSLKDTGFFGLKLNMGNYTDPQLTMRGLAFTQFIC